MSHFDDITPDYAFYENVYRGHRLDETAFSDALTNSVGEVDCRIRNDAVLPDDVLDKAMMAVCSIAEAVGDSQSRLRSYTAGKVSETFDSPPFSLTAEAAVKRYLSGTGVLRGGRWV